MSESERTSLEVSDQVSRPSLKRRTPRLGAADTQGAVALVDCWDQLTKTKYVGARVARHIAPLKATSLTSRSEWVWVREKLIGAGVSKESSRSPLPYSKLRLRRLLALRTGGAVTELHEESSTFVMLAAGARPITNSAATAALASCQGQPLFSSGITPQQLSSSTLSWHRRVTALFMLTLRRGLSRALSLCGLSLPSAARHAAAGELW